MTCWWNGLVHGSSTVVGSFFARVETNGLNNNYCAVGDTDSGWYSSNYVVTSGTATCSDWSKNHGMYVINECRGAASVGKDGFVSIHTHYAHNYGGDCKVYIV